ncbi:MAG: hypothetical protein WB760_33830 [Xanthobacteraceae bacterium]
MRIHISCMVLALALASAAPTAHAQTVYTQEPDGTIIAQQPVVLAPSTVVTQPTQTVRTVTTVRTERPIARHRVEVTRQTTVRYSVVPPARRVVAPTVATVNPAPPLYDVVGPAPAPVVTDPYDDQPIYDAVVQAPAPTVVAPVVNETVIPAPAVTVGTAMPFYRYVYQPDRILVIDPSTGIAVQAIPR